MRYLWSGDEWVTAPTAPIGRIAVISDRMEALLHPVTGQITDSKSHFRAMTRDSGCVELGNDAPVAESRPNHAESERKERREAIRRAIWELENGRPAPRTHPEGGGTRRYG